MVQVVVENERLGRRTPLGGDGHRLGIGLRWPSLMPSRSHDCPLSREPPPNQNDRFTDADSSPRRCRSLITKPLLGNSKNFGFPRRAASIGVCATAQVKAWERIQHSACQRFVSADFLLMEVSMKFRVQIPTLLCVLTAAAIPASAIAKEKADLSRLVVVGNREEPSGESRIKPFGYKQARSS